MSQVQSMPRRAAAMPHAHRPGAPRLLWSRIKRFFPPHSEVLQTARGGLEITWCLTGELGTRYATPVMVRLEREWVDELETADEWGRNVMIAKAAETVRLGMFGYEPVSALPQARIIIVG
jgi:hypothetical protein